MMKFSSQIKYFKCNPFYSSFFGELNQPLKMLESQGLKRIVYTHSPLAIKLQTLKCRFIITHFITEYASPIFIKEK